MIWNNLLSPIKFSDKKLLIIFTLKAGLKSKIKILWILILELKGKGYKPSQTENPLLHAMAQASLARTHQ